MKKIYLLFLILFPIFVSAQFDQKMDSLVNTIQLTIEFFDVETDKQLVRLTDIQSDTLRMKCIITVPNSIPVEYFEMPNFTSTSDYEVTENEILLIDPKELDNERRTYCLYSSLFIPKKSGKIEIPEKTLLFKIKKPINALDFFGNQAYETGETELKLKSKSVVLEFQ